MLSFFLLISACKTAKEEYSYSHDAQGFYNLEKMADEQIERLAEETGTSLEKLMDYKERGISYAPYYINSYGDTSGRGLIRDPNSVFDVLNLLYIEKCIEMNISPNPTTSSIHYYITAYYDKKQNYFEMHPVRADFQLVYNERIIHQWSIENYNSKIQELPANYLQERGTYKLACYLTGPRGNKAVVSGTFMVKK